MALACAVVSVSAADVGLYFLVQTNDLPVGGVPVVARLVKLTVEVVGQLLRAVAGVTSGFGVPATQQVVTVSVAAADCVPHELLSWVAFTLYLLPLTLQVTLDTVRVATLPVGVLPTKLVYIGAEPAAVMSVQVVPPSVLVCHWYLTLSVVVVAKVLPFKGPITVAGYVVPATLAETVEANVVDALWAMALFVGAVAAVVMAC